MSRENGGFGLFGFLLGAAAGAVAGVLLAPRSGKETRARVKEWLEDRREKGQELVSKLREEKESLSTAVKAGKEAYQEARRHNHEHAGV